MTTYRIYGLWHGGRTYMKPDGSWSNDETEAEIFQVKPNLVFGALCARKKAAEPPYNLAIEEVPPPPSHVTVGELRRRLATMPDTCFITLSDGDGYNCDLRLYAATEQLLYQESTDGNGGLFTLENNR